MKTGIRAKRQNVASRKKQKIAKPETGWCTTGVEECYSFCFLIEWRYIEPVSVAESIKRQNVKEQMGT